MAVQKWVRPALELSHYTFWDTFFTNIIIICRNLSLPITKTWEEIPTKIKTLSYHKFKNEYKRILVNSQR